MSITKFPFIALALSAIFLVVLTLGGQVQTNGMTLLPLLTLLLVSEFGFIMNLIAVYVVIKHRLKQTTAANNIVLIALAIGFSVYFLTQGLSFWPR